MKKFMLLFCVSFLSNLCLGQTLTPINSIQYGYDENKELVLTLILSKEPEDDFKVALVGSVNWTSGSATLPQDKIIKVNLTKDASNPVKYYGSLRVKDPSTTTKKWDRIEDITITYSHNSTLFELPKFTIYHKITDLTATTVAFKVDDEGFIIAQKKIKIGLRTEPNGVPSVVTGIRISTTNLASETITIDKASINGNFDLELNLRTLDISDGIYTIEIEGKTLDGAVSLRGTNKTFIKKSFPVAIESFNDNERIKIKDTDIYESFVTVNDGAAKVMQIVFLDKDFKDNVKPIIEKRNGNIFKFKLSGLNNVVESKFSQFYFVFDGKNASKICRVEILEPKVNNLSFDVSNSKFSKLKFNVQEWVAKDRIEVQFGNKIIFPSAMLLESTTGQVKTFSIDFYNELNSFFQKDSKVKNDSIYTTEIQILHNRKPIYDFNITFYNQEILTKKLNQLIAATKISKKQDRKVAVKKTMEDITSVITKLGGAVEDTEVQAAIATLTDNNKDVEKVSSTIAKVGKWVGTMAPKVIPFVLAAL